MKKPLLSVLVLVIFRVLACTQSADAPAASPPAAATQPPVAQPTTPPAPVSPSPTAEAMGETMGITSPLDEAIDGLGGKDALENLSSFVIDSTILRFANGEGLQPNFETDAPSELTLSMAYDVQSDNLRLDCIRESPAPTEYSEIISGNLGYMVGRDARFGNSEGANLTSDKLASSRKQQRLLNPHLILRERRSKQLTLHPSYVRNH